MEIVIRIVILLIINAVIAAIVFYFRRDESKPAYLGEGAILLEFSERTRRLVRNLSIFVFVLIVGILTAMWLKLDSWYPRIFCTVVGVVLVIALGLYVRRVTSYRAVVTDEGISVESFGREQLMLFEDIVEIRETSDAWKLRLHDKRKVFLFKGLVGLDEAL